MDGEGKIVEGLSFDTGNGYYFYSGWRKEAEVKQKKKTRKDYQFGRDYDEAVYAFKQWVEKDKVFSDIPYNSILESGEPISAPEDAIDIKDVKNALERHCTHPIICSHKFVPVANNKWEVETAPVKLNEK